MLLIQNAYLNPTWTPQQAYYMDSLPGSGPVYVRSDSLELTKIDILM